MATGRRVGVILVDPLPVVRAGLRMVIESRPHVTVLGEFGDADNALEAAGQVKRQRVVVVVGMGLEGDHDAGWLIRSIREQFPTLVVVAMGANSDSASISRMLFIGADGFLDKSLEPDEFVESIERAANHEMVLAGPAALVGVIADSIERRVDLDAKLTQREQEVLVVAAEGLSAREIAARLGVRERTVTTHLSRIYGKLGVGNRLAAIRAAVRSGLVSVGPVQ